MKKLFLSFVAAIVAATATYAQNTLVATLSHGENVTMYYGTYALRDAHNAAVSGDVINLSGGGFQPVNITKAVTIRGTGITEAVPTSIVSYFDINIPTNDTNRFIMEGIRCTYIYMRGSFENPYFLKCSISNIYFSDSPVIKNAMFVNCKIYEGFTLRGTSSAQLINSYVSRFDNQNETTSSASFINCIIRTSAGYESNNIKSCQLMNCILYRDYNSTSSSLPSTTIATNCIAINDNNGMANLFNNSQVNPNCSHHTYAEVFKDFTGGYNDAQTFELTDEAKAKFLGTDGTQVGLYGGLMPFTLIPSYPRITKMNVASKTTTDGKLSVEIEVSAAE